ncbi:MAG TPA: hypothetical protein VGU45_01580 [Microvirga sp.]|nr:hypothetical protein [Microvirga sp.]
MALRSWTRLIRMTPFKPIQGTRRVAEIYLTIALFLVTMIAVADF